VYTTANVTHVLVGSASIWVGEMHTLQASVLSHGGTPPAVSWSVQDPSIAEIDATGQVRGLKPGTTRVRAECGGKFGEAVLEVFANLQGETVLRLAPGEDMNGQIRVAVPIENTTWTDESGVQRQAEKYVVGGTLKLFTNGGGPYEQQLEVQTVIREPQYRVVAREARIDRGQINYDMLQGYRYYLVSTTTPGTQMTAQFFRAGRLVVFQKIGIAPTLDYVYYLN
jgi:hypothetical protein